MPHRPPNTEPTLVAVPSRGPCRVEYRTLVGDEVRLERVAYRIAHIRHGSCFANMHDVADKLRASGFCTLDRLADRTPGWFAAAFKRSPAALAFVQVFWHGVTGPKTRALLTEFACEKTGEAA